MLIEGKKRHIRKASCFARVLEVYDFSLDIEVRPDTASQCIQHEDGSFLITLQAGLCKHWETVHIAHEMVHLRQFKHDQLREDGPFVWWKGEKFIQPEYMSDEYFLSPWEMEARGMEDWLAHKWSIRKNELH